MTFDKKLKILNCLEFGEYKSYSQLQQETKIPEPKFSILFDSLGFNHYIGPAYNGSGRVSLYNISAKQRYLHNRCNHRLTVLSFVFSFVAAVAAILALL